MYKNSDKFAKETDRETESNTERERYIKLELIQV